MGTRRKRRRRDEEREDEEEREEPQEKARAVATEARPADRVLELQKTAGNRAVGAAIARWGLPWFPQTAAPQWPKEPQVIMDGNVIPMSSFSWSDPHGGTGAAGAGKAGSGGEVSISTTLGDHSAELARRTTDGRPYKTVIIVMPHKDGTGVTITFTEAFVSGYQITGEQESWTLNFKTRELTQSPPQAQARP
ncbi:MAG: Type secretion system effector, Hcp [Solirubrobacteraceae bacterium]|jgi:hypothetical protein|nr:Type secretion system effector, Hcp [Solirubrobacteraceae bacterium]